MVKNCRTPDDFDTSDNVSNEYVGILTALLMPKIEAIQAEEKTEIHMGLVCK